MVALFLATVVLFCGKKLGESWLLLINAPGTEWKWEDIGESYSQEGTITIIWKKLTPERTMRWCRVWKVKVRSGNY